MLEQYQLAPKEEDEMEDFRDFDDEHSDLGSKLDEFADEEEDEEEIDVLVVQTIVLFVSTIYIAVNLLADIAYALIDPRIRFER